MQSISWETLGWMKHKLESKFLGEISIIWDMQIAAAAKSLQSCLTLCDPIDGSPPGSPVPGILRARTLKWVAISFSNAWKWKVKAKSLSRVQLSATPRTAAYQAPLSMDFPGKSTGVGCHCLLRICRLCHRNIRTWRGTKEPLDKGERKRRVGKLA